MHPDWSRRRFVASSGALGSAAWLKLSAPVLGAIASSACDARDAAAPYKSLSAEAAREITAISARLIPTTDTPGATEAGVIHFFDQSLAGVMADELPRVLAGLDGFLEALSPEHAGQTFAELDSVAQDAYLKTQEGSEFFEFMRLMTIYGFFAMPTHGGNRDHLSWDLIGFAGHGAWTPPFGYYDTEASQ